MPNRSAVTKHLGLEFCSGEGMVAATTLSINSTPSVSGAVQRRVV